jgi:CRP-like cAMP-binding protein
MVQNRLLASLAPEDWATWEPHFEHVHLGYRQEILHPGERITHLWFPEGGIQSQVVETIEGDSVEVAVIGAEGVVGLPAIFGVFDSATRTIAQMETTAWRIRAEDFRKHLHPDYPLLRRIERYAAAVLGSLAQIAACNRLHSVEQRLSRWLLTVYDRVRRNQIPMTHEFMSLMLGTRRATVTEVAGELQKRMLIRYEPGTMEFTDVQALHANTCECYDVIQRLFEEASTWPPMPR